ncbi:MAG: hypothetical protein K8S55_15460 [Phycisphaerae bacterium]|nr:hypothetical protein [Phycisphaerae bacterium]
MSFEPDYRHIVDVAMNKKPARFPLYEHIVSTEIMAKVLDVDMTMPDSGKESDADYREFYSNYCRFWKETTYDTVSFECCFGHALPDSGALCGGRPGPIQNRGDFEKYPFDGIADTYWQYYTPHLDALAAVMPEGMKAIGGCGNGVFEIIQDLVGFEYLCLMQADDPELVADLFVKIGDIMTGVWSQMLERYGDVFCVCRMGDDLGYKTATMLSPPTIIEHIVPQYRRIIKLVHDAGKPFLLHSCGNIFAVMDEIIDAGIDAKHSNEDLIAPYSEWIDRYSDRIGLFGGIDVGLICQEEPQAIFDYVVEHGTEYRKRANGYALGSGNSIPDYVPVEKYLAMVDAVKEIRRREAQG